MTMSPLPETSSANAVTVAAVQQRLGQVREDLVQPIREATGAVTMACHGWL